MDYGEAVVDISNVSQGYVAVRYSGNARKISIEITGKNDKTYKYFVNKTMSRIDDRLWKAYHSSKSKRSYIQKISKTLSDLEGVTYNGKDHTVQFQKNITQKQQIRVKTE